MSTELVTVPLEESLQAAVDRMLEHRVGSVLVTSGDEPAGIITETDVLAAGAGFERPFTDIPVSRAMSDNIVTIGPGASVEEAVERMQEFGIKKLPVVEDDTLIGIVTMTDLVFHQHQLAQEAKELEATQAPRELTTHRFTPESEE